MKCALGINIYLFLWAFESLLKRKVLCLEDVFSARGILWGKSETDGAWKVDAIKIAHQDENAVWKRFCEERAFYDVPTQGCEWDVCWVCLMENTQNISIIYDIYNKLRLWGGVSFEFPHDPFELLGIFLLLLNSSLPWSFLWEDRKVLEKLTFYDEIVIKFYEHKIIIFMVQFDIFLMRLI